MEKGPKVTGENPSWPGVSRPMFLVEAARVVGIESIERD